jgi:hypothetical protein
MLQPYEIEDDSSELLSWRGLVVLALAIWAIAWWIS